MKFIMNLLTALMLFIPLQSSAQTSEDPSATIDSFRTALAEGDIEVVNDVLADNVLIFEGSQVERSLSEYSAHHLKSDIKFTQAVRSKLIERTVYKADGLAVVSSRYSVSGSYNKREVDLTMNETMTLRNEPELGWKIIRIHWSN